jgi:hypothetical protein
MMEEIMRKGLLCLALGVAVLLVPSPPPLVAQNHGGGGGGGGCGDVFGDLIHVLRHPVTGQPILQKRWVELPKDVPNYGWGYCVVAVDEYGAELGFAPLSCDVAEAELEKVVEVDYFGRLNGGRTKERNNRMHFNEVLSSIKVAGYVKEGPAGRLTLGYDCVPPNPGNQVKCEEWSTVDSPMESLGLYSRLMKYGHFQTNPWELDEWHAGDPKLPVQYQPALGPEDYAKFHRSLQHLLPSVADPWACFTDENDNLIWEPTEPFTDLEPFNGVYDVGERFMDINANDVRDDGGDAFIETCMDRESLDDRDFTRAGSFLGAAANKTGKSTRDLIQYVNRILKITKKTPHTEPTLDALPAIVRECGVGEGWEEDPTGDDQVEPPYTEVCSEDPAYPEIENGEYFPDVLEKFVDFAAAEYDRMDWRNEDVEVIRPGLSEESWTEDKAWLMGWLGYANGPAGAPIEDIDAFLEATSDAIRSIQFLHNYSIPEHLWDFESSAPPPPEEVKIKDKGKKK